MKKEERERGKSAEQKLRLIERRGVVEWSFPYRVSGLQSLRNKVTDFFRSETCLSKQAINNSKKLQAGGSGSRGDDVFATK